MSDNKGARRLSVSETEVFPGRPVRYYLRYGHHAEPDYLAEEYLVSDVGGQRLYQARAWHLDGGSLVEDKSLLWKIKGAVGWHKALSHGLGDPGYLDAESALLKAVQMADGLRRPVALADAAGMTPARIAVITGRDETEIAALIAEAREGGVIRMRVTGAALPTPESDTIRFVLDQVPGAGQHGDDDPLWFADEARDESIMVTTSTGETVDDPVVVARLRLAIARSRSRDLVDLGDDPPFSTAPAPPGPEEIREIEDNLARAAGGDDKYAFESALCAAVGAEIPVERMAEVSGRPLEDMVSAARRYRRTS